MARMTTKYWSDINSYADFYRGKEHIYGESGYPMSLVYALDAVIKEITGLEAKPRLKVKKLSKAHRYALERYVEYYIKGETGRSDSIARAIKAALKRIDELRAK